jgi:hypothetical protein
MKAVAHPPESWYVPKDKDSYSRTKKNLKILSDHELETRVRHLYRADRRLPRCEISSVSES